MEKKTLSKPMKEILTRLEEFEYIKTHIFPESTILNVRKIYYQLSPLRDHECLVLFRNL